MISNEYQTILSHDWLPHYFETHTNTLNTDFCYTMFVYLSKKHEDTILVINYGFTVADDKLGGL